MKKLFFVLLCWMIPMFVYADDTIEYKVYDQQGNYEFSCQYHSLEGMINDESLKYDLSYCISKNKNNILKQEEYCFKTFNQNTALQIIQQII